MTTDMLICDRYQTICQTWDVPIPWLQKPGNIISCIYSLLHYVAHFLI